MLFRSGPPEDARKATARDFLRILLDPGSIARLRELCTEIEDRLADESHARLSADPERENAANASAVSTSRQLRASGLLLGFDLRWDKSKENKEALDSVLDRKSTRLNSSH